MIYNHINSIQRISKEINMLETNIVLQVSILCVVKNIKFDPNLLFIYLSKYLVIQLGIFNNLY